MDDKFFQRTKNLKKFIIKVSFNEIIGEIRNFIGKIPGAMQQLHIAL